VRVGDKRSNPTPYADYPHPDAEEVVLYPQGGGRKVGGLDAQRPERAGEETLVDDVSQSGGKLAAARSSKHRLLYATAELASPLHLSGAPRLSIRLAADEPAANLSVWLVSLPWTEGGAITDNILTRGWADPQNRNSLRESRPLKPGEFVELTFDLEPDDQIVPVGQQLGLMIFSSDRDFTLWPKKGTELSVDLKGTSLSLPVVGGAAALERALGR